MDVNTRISKLKETFKNDLERARERTPKKRRYPKKFHRAIVDLLNKGVKAKIIQKEFNLSITTIFAWKNKYVSNNDGPCPDDHQTVCDFIELNISDKAQSSNTKKYQRVPDNKQLVTAPTTYTLTTPSGYKVCSLSKDDLLSLIHSLECGQMSMVKPVVL